MRRISYVMLPILFVLPFGYVVLLSISAAWRFPSLLPEGLDLSPWQAVFGQNATVGSSFLLSVGLSATVAAAATIAGFWVGKAISESRRRGVFETLAYFPYSFSPVIYAACLNFFFIKAHLTGNTEGVVVAQFFVTFPFAVILFIGHWNDQMQAMENLVLTLGGSPRDAFWRVLLPISKPILLISFFQTFLISWFEYGLTARIGLGKVPTLTIKVFQFIGESNASVAAVASVLLMFPPLILLWFNRRFVFINN